MATITTTVVNGPPWGDNPPWGDGPPPWVTGGGPPPWVDDDDDDEAVDGPCADVCNAAYDAALEIGFEEDPLCDEESNFIGSYAVCALCIEENDINVANADSVIPELEPYLVLCDIEIVRSTTVVSEASATPSTLVFALDAPISPMTTSSPGTTFSTSFTTSFSSSLSTPTSTTASSSSQGESSAAPGNETGDGSDDPSGGQIAGAAVGSVAGFASLIAVAFWLWRRRYGKGSDGDYSEKSQATESMISSTRSPPPLHERPIAKISPDGLYEVEGSSPMVADSPATGISFNGFVRRESTKS